jgi:ferredoxin--NADP+ reductase
MRFSSASLLIAALSSTTTSAFAFAPSKASVAGAKTNTKLFANAGAGVATVAAGDKKLFDPGMEGMLGGSSDLEKRLSMGAGAVASTPTPTASSAITPDDRKKKVKGAGAGIALVAPGDRMLWDPEVEGMMGGTTSLDRRLKDGINFKPLYFPAASSAQDVIVPPPAGTFEAFEAFEAQGWLEDIGVPQNFAKPTAPVTATVLGRVNLISDEAPGDIQHLVLRLPEGFHYVEGQSISVIPPGVQENGKPNKARLYSIASTRYGDLLDGNTVSLCVRRAEYYDPETNQVDDAKQGVCSKFLCDRVPGMTVQIAGPIGKTMLLPENPSTDIIMVATGTGIAPFRAFLHRLFMENTVARQLFTGKAWLVLGVPVTGGLLYPQEIDAMKYNAAQSGLNNLEVTYAISREMKSQQGGKFYVQDALAEQADKLFDRLQGGAQIYFCGLKGMMPGILTALEQVAVSRGIDWSTFLKELQANHQWHVEVY